MFANELPLYKLVESLDGCNFRDSTVWEGKITKGYNYNFYQDKKGYQFIDEASNLKEIKSGSYDFLLASHCLEHCANTLKTMHEWVRVIKPDGIIVLVLPCKQFTFDHNREVTTFSHLLQDFADEIDEKDLTHLEEILKLHDLSMDLPAGNLESFKQRSLSNFENRCLHHHVFDFDLLESLCKYFKLSVKFKRLIPPYHQVIIAKKDKNLNNGSAGK